MDWPRLHAAANDLPAALLVFSVAFDLLGAITRRDSLKAAGFWTLLAGGAGEGAAIATGLLAEGVIEHSDQAHAVMETHQTLSIIVMILFALLALWRAARRGVLGDREQTVALTAGVIGVALIVYTGNLGGRLVFEHATGISAARMDSIQAERIGEHEHQGGAAHDHGAPAAPAAAPGDTAAGMRDSAKADTGMTHTHDDGKKHTHAPDTSKNR